MVKDERLAHRQKAGIVLAFLGIVVAFATHSATTTHSLLGDGLALLAGLCWGLTTVILRITPLGSLPAKQMLVYQLLMVFVILLIYGFVTHQAQLTLSTVGVLSIAFQAIFISFVASMAWFWLLGRYRSADIGALVLMTPIFGVVLSAWILDETISTSFVIGAVMVLVGIVLVGKRSKS